MNDGKLGKVGARILGILMAVFGLWGVLVQEYSHEGTPLRSGLNVSGEKAVIIGLVVLIYGLYILYLSFNRK